jgi:hypothetical protein
MLTLRQSAQDRFSVGFPQVSRGFCRYRGVGMVICRVAGMVVGVALSAGLPCSLLWDTVVSY